MKQIITAILVILLYSCSDDPRGELYTEEYSFYRYYYSDYNRSKYSYLSDPVILKDSSSNKYAILVGCDTTVKMEFYNDGARYNRHYLDTTISNLYIGEKKWYVYFPDERRYDSKKEALKDVNLYKEAFKRKTDEEIRIKILDSIYTRNKIIKDSINNSIKYEEIR